MKNKFVYFDGTELTKCGSSAVMAKGLAVMRVGKQTPVTHICPILRNGKISNSAILPIPDNKRGELAGALLGTTRDLAELFLAMVAGTECTCQIVTGPVVVTSVGVGKCRVYTKYGDNITVPTNTISVPWPAG